jgi:hypothetical protein
MRVPATIMAMRDPVITTMIAMPIHLPRNVP